MSAAEAPAPPSDPLWPRASTWLSRHDDSAAAGADLALLGVPAYRSSITPTGAHATPAAIRDALGRYSTWAGGRGIDVAALSALDLGDVESPDGSEGEARLVAAASAAMRSCDLLVALGGDNSITYSLVRAMPSAATGGLEGCGLVTVDAHHDLRDGETNGSPVRRLVEAGLPGGNIVQVGIADFSNSAAYAARARDHGITVIPRREMEDVGTASAIARALEIAGQGGRPIFVDIDVDVCDRAAVPGCPSAAPGGISARELREIAFACGRDPRVRGVDIVEIDATIDSADQRTVRLAALLVLELAAGLCERQGRCVQPAQAR